MGSILVLAVLAAACAVVGTVYLLRRPLRRARMATLKKTTTRAVVKKTVAKAANAVAKKAPAKRADPVPRVTAARLTALTSHGEEWMTPDVKKVRSDYYAALVTAVNAAIAAAWARFKAQPTARWAFHLHHEALLEPLQGDAGDTGAKGALERIRYVVADKNFGELLARFRVMRPVPQAKIVELQEATKAAKTSAPPPEPAHRITLAEVEKLARVVSAKRGAVAALDPKKTAEAVHQKLADAWRRFNIESSGYYNKTYRIGNRIAYDDVIRYAKEWWDAAHATPDASAVDAAQKELADAVREYDDLNNEYSRQERERESARRRNSAVYRDSSRPADVTDDQIWALHAELCEPDCPYTKDHKSVIPAKIKTT